MIGEVLICLEDSSKKERLHQGLDCVVHCIDFDIVKVVLKVFEYFLFLPLNVEEIFY